MGPLDSYLPYLLNRAGARIAASFSEEVRPLGATLQMWRVLAALRERDGRRMGDLSETTSIEVSTLTRLVDAMEQKGLVARRRDAGDARAVMLRATAAGRRALRIDPSGAIGSGLGLAIVHWAMTLHGGRIRAEPRKDGLGNVFVAEFPSSQESSAARPVAQ